MTVEVSHGTVSSAGTPTAPKSSSREDSGSNAGEVIARSVPPAVDGDTPPLRGSPGRSKKNPLTYVLSGRKSSIERVDIVLPGSPRRLFLTHA